MFPETKNTTMELDSVTQVSGSESTDAVRALLDDKLQVMRELKTGQELNARQIGVEVKDIVDRELWRQAGYWSKEHCLQEKFKEIGSPRNLLRYVDIARRFTDDDIRCHTTKKLEAILGHETLTGQQMSSDNLGEQEIRLKQKDGSEVVKKVKDCSANEVIRSNTRVRKSGETKPATSQYGSRSKLVLASVGAVMLVVGELLPSWEVASILAVLGATLLFIGGSQLIRHGFNWLKTFIRSGQALEVLAALPAKLSGLSRDGVHGLQWLWSFIRSGPILHALAKLPTRVWSLVRAAVRKQAVDTVSKPPTQLPSPKAGSDGNSPPVSTPPSQSPQTGDGNTKLAA